MPAYGRAMRRVAVLAPMSNELAPLVRRLSLRRSRAGDLVVHRGTLGDAEIVATMAGVGSEAAASVTERLLGAEPFDHVVVIGIAGALNGEPAIGALVVPEAVIDGPTDREFRPTPIGGHVPKGKLRTGGEFLLSDEELDRLRQRGVVALDMETSGIAEVCDRLGTPWSVFRAISDRSSDHSDTSVLDMVKPDGTPNLPAAARFILTHPWRVPFLVRLARGSSQAVRATVDAAVAALRSAP
jgi:adenosylhomocysteine nucleosidase